jgi:hypothetical protein
MTTTMYTTQVGTRLIVLIAVNSSLLDVELKTILPAGSHASGRVQLCLLYLLTCMHACMHAATYNRHAYYIQQLRSRLLLLHACSKAHMYVLTVYVHYVVWIVIITQRNSQRQISGITNHSYNLCAITWVPINLHACSQLLWRFVSCICLSHQQRFHHALSCIIRKYKYKEMPCMHIWAIAGEAAHRRILI